LIFIGRFVFEKKLDRGYLDRIKREPVQISGDISQMLHYFSLFIEIGLLKSQEKNRLGKLLREKRIDFS